MYRWLLADADDIQIRLADRPRFIFRNLPRSPVLAHRMRVGLGQPAWIAHDLSPIVAYNVDWVRKRFADPLP